MNNIDYLENIIKKHLDHALTILFPTSKNNKILIYIISIFHIIGTLVLQYGILLKTKYLYYYLVYLMIILFSYYIFNNDCFMTLISNKYSGLNKPAIFIKPKTAKMLIIINFMITIVSLFFPKISPHSLIKKLFTI